MLALHREPQCPGIRNATKQFLLVCLEGLLCVSWAAVRLLTCEASCVLLLHGHSPWLCVVIRPCPLWASAPTCRTVMGEWGAL